MQDAYPHFPIYPPYQRFLHFAIEDKCIEFVALQFGISSAPRVFTKVLAPLLMAETREEAVHVPWAPY